MNLFRTHPFPSKLITPRNVDIWLPPGYAQDSEQRFPVLYMHDGQNLFDPEFSYKKVDWGVDPAIKRLIAAGNFTPPIVVGIWNTANRLGEYLPEAPMQNPKVLARAIRLSRRRLGDIQFDLKSDTYLAFIVEELKPWVDTEFSTLADQPNTHIAGSSLGGLISMYAVCQHPDVFCGAGCVSTAWNFGRDSMIPYFSKHLPDPSTHRLYFDMGGKETHRPYMNRQLLKDQSRMDKITREAGYHDNKSLLSLTFPKHKHDESAWRERVEGMIEFLIE
jgi:predicted alpha/beta superfamily hydrolase